MNSWASSYSLSTKDGNGYELTTLRGMIASFEWYLKWKNYQANIINDLKSEKTHKTRQSKQKQLKKQGRNYVQGWCNSELSSGRRQVFRVQRTAKKKITNCLEGPW